MEIATFAAGCFWGVQSYFDQVPGVKETLVGYTGGHTDKPTYEQVCSHTTGHAEAIQIKFDPGLTGYEDLVRHFFRMHDPTQMNRQGPDIGDSYRSAIFYHNEQQKLIASKVLAELQDNYDKPIVTEVTVSKEFYPAEDYHQKYTEKTGYGACHIAYTDIS